MTTPASAFLLLHLLLFVFSQVGAKDTLTSTQVTCTDGSTYPLPPASDLVYDCGPGKYFALTVDDVPRDEMLTVLQLYGVKVTFFIEGNTLNDEPESRPRLLRAYNLGHKIQHHSYSHTSFALPPISTNCSLVRWEMERTLELIRSTLGIPTYQTTLFRPPFGEMGDFSRAILSSLGSSGRPGPLDSDYTIIQWNLDAEDWKPEVTTADVLKVVSDALKNNTLGGSGFNLRRGSFLMLNHDRPTDNTAFALYDIIPMAWKAGFRFVTVDQCLCLRAGGSADSCGVQPIPNPIPQYTVDTTPGCHCSNYLPK